MNPEFIINGTFDTDLSGWTDNSTAPSEVLWNAGAVSFMGMEEGANAVLTQTVNLPHECIDKNFKLSFDISSLNMEADYRGSCFIGSNSDEKKYGEIVIDFSGIYEIMFTDLNVLDLIFTFDMEGVGSSFLLDNVSFREQG
jgi:hypothetical protein